MSKQEPPAFPDWLCLEWEDGRRIRIAVLDVSDVIQAMRESGSAEYISHEQFGAFVAALMAYTIGAAT